MISPRPGHHVYDHQLPGRDAPRLHLLLEHRDRQDRQRDGPGVVERLGDLGREPVVRFEEKQGVGTICRDLLVNNGLVMRAVRDTIVCAPPFTLSHDEADELLEKAWKCLDLTQQALGNH